MIPWLRGPEDALPDTRRALPPGSEAPGLLAAGGELTPQRLREAYSKGVFPWYSEGQPVLWWSPDPRMVLLVDEFRLKRSLRKTIAKFIHTPGNEVRIDSAFRQVITACAGTPREGQDGTWIVPEMVEAYVAWHKLGTVHSVETWMGGELVGGLYGVSLGRMVFGESMFSHRTDASKIALAALVCFCREHGVAMIDCQQRTGHLASLGGRELPRAEFEQRLTRGLGEPPIGEWTYDPSLWRHLGISAGGADAEQDTGP
ncbi:leucyl/phenylalanyl-tRNA--protein transferase [Rhizobacter sp. AJA081-3]|uniref:leucyl/phenylalanyl-tRNA--protein transferase n=1 Tax=Rhizobacter sp. AJA081-3 TaxID=2753607 RepID=UPI001ADF68C4|nr:leucyl/phenylalanyl-tRNA--protein transferase [Rhizobacter sp. AJA081-3]QTN24636.1 leucyl/phenylalanyl-tRNA--protein transferase [Rhizobacter sp. AJA081-3]